MNTTQLSHLAISDTGFIFNPHTGHTFTANETGLFFLHALKQDQPPDQISQRALAEYEVDSDQLQRDMQDFIIQLREIGLIT